MTLSDTEVIQWVNREFVPCWESVRPVPKVSIDFGDGRVLKRTLQGNTVMYVVLPDGRVVDALPGVYTPEAFLQQVKETLEFLHSTPTEPSAAFTEALTSWHRARVTLAVRSEIMRITMSKGFVESPLLAALGIPVRSRPAAGSSLPDPTVNAGAAFAALSARIEDLSHQPATVEQLRKRVLPPKTQPMSPEELGKVAVQMDSANNVRLIRPAVHLLFCTYSQPPQPEACRDAVYKKVLHVAIDDPYLGLADAVVPGTP